MKRLLILISITILIGCKKEQISILDRPTNDTIPTAFPTKKQYQLFFDFDSLKNATGIEIMNGPIIIDYNNNGRYDIIVNRNIMNRTANSYQYELLNPVVILDNNTIVEVTNLWKGGTTSAVADFNGDGFLDICIMDNGPEYWDLNPNPPKTPLTVYWNKNGVFDGTKTFVKEMLIGCFNINTADVDGDGKFEIIPMGNQFEDFSYEFDGTNFIKTEIRDLKNISHSAAMYGDFDKNGSVDVFSYGFHTSGNLDLFKPTIIHNVHKTNDFNQINIGENVYINIMLSGDFDKNGYTDFILIARKQGLGGIPLNNNHYLFYVKNDGNKKYFLDTKKLPEYIDVSPSIGYPMLYNVSDIDGDGDLDFYNVNSKMKILFINDNGNFKNGLQ